MQKLLISLLFIASLLVGGCSTNKIPGVYRPDIQQGNVVTQEMVDKLRPGMTRQQVAYVMGTPLLVDVFHQDRWDYLYSMEASGEERRQEKISIYFEDDRLVRIAGDFRPMPARNPATQDRETVHTVPDYEEREQGFFSRTMESIGLDSEDEQTTPVTESEEPEQAAPAEETVIQDTDAVEAEQEEQGFFSRMWSKIGFGSDEEE
jgi:outer membrane protein assembly factor BamE